MITQNKTFMDAKIILENNNETNTQSIASITFLSNEIVKFLSRLNNAKKTNIDLNLIKI